MRGWTGTLRLQCELPVRPDCAYECTYGYRKKKRSYTKICRKGVRRLVLQFCVSPCGLRLSGLVCPGLRSSSRSRVNFWSSMEAEGGEKKRAIERP